MNLSEAKAIVAVQKDSNDAFAQIYGAKTCYKSGLHFNVIPVDFERAVEEEVPNKQWAGSRGTHTAIRFAMWETRGGTLTLSTEFDCLKS